MGWWFAILISFSSVTWGASASSTINNLSSQVSILWQSVRPTCVMALEPNMQAGVAERLNFLDENLISSELVAGLSQAAADRSAQWRSPIWGAKEQLETAALKVEERESLREYFFKLQTQTPNPQRSQLVADIQYMSQVLNTALRKELWKTCHALGLSQLPAAQVETSVEQRWLAQEEKVALQIKRELAAFYFYSYRQTGNETLKTFADVMKPLKPWVDTTASALTSHFKSIREQLTNLPLLITPDVTDEPFLEDRPWPPSPSQGLLQP